jgi:hypothetical protein
LNIVSVGNSPDKAGKSLIDLRAAGCVEHFHTPTFAANQSRLSENLEVLRERRFWDVHVADGQKVGATPRALGPDNLREDGHPYRIAQRMKNPFDRDVF